MKNILAPFCLFLFVTAGCAQQKTATEKAYAYFRISLPGNIPVDDQGNPEQRTDTVHQVYLETRSQAPDIAYITLNGLQYDAIAVSMEEVQVGKRAVDNEMIFLRARPGFALWQLDLSAPVGVATTREHTVGIRDARKNIRIVRLPQPVQLVPEERY